MGSDALVFKEGIVFDLWFLGKVVSIIGCCGIAHSYVFLMKIKKNFSICLGQFIFAYWAYFLVELPVPFPCTHLLQPYSGRECFETAHSLSLALWRRYLSQGISSWENGGFYIKDAYRDF